MAVALIAVAAGLHRLFDLQTSVFLNVLLVAFALGALAILLAIVGFASIWRTGTRGTGAAAAGTLIGLVILTWPASYAPQVITQAPLNDVTTDFEAPPEFNEIAKLRPVGANATRYSGRAASRVQEALFPDLRPLIVDRPADETFELVVQAIRRTGHEIIAETEPEGPRAGRIEATARTLILGFRDDVVVRVIGRARRSRVDIRSASRWGRYDFGANARRVRSIIRAIRQRLNATVPRGANGG
ncbi:MAG: DUF1499 domain-containing protein [Pseudomonadota bacterium]